MAQGIELREFGGDKRDRRALAQEVAEMAANGG